MASLPGRLQPVSLAALATTWTVVTCFATPVGAQESAKLIVPPAVVHSVGNGSTEPAATVQQASEQSAVRSAIETPEVVLTAGILDGVFGGNKPKVAKKEHEDGRKATPLPPPDPNSVNWSGIPFHKPAPPTEKIESGKSQPISDYTGSGATRPAPTTRNVAPLPSANANLRRAPGEVTTPSKTASATNRSVPPIPPAPLTTSQPSSKSATTSVPPQVSKPAYSNDISSVESTRRTGRRAINALDPESMVLSPNDDSEVPSEPVSLTEPLPAPSVSRRALMPIELSMDRMTKVESSNVEALPELPKFDAPTAGQSTTIAMAPEKSDIPMLPPSSRPSASLEDSWNSIGSGVSRSTQTPATTVSSPVAMSAPAIDTPAKAPSASGSFGPSAQSEQALRESLLAAKEKAAKDAAATAAAVTPKAPAASATATAPALTATVARKSEGNVKQLGSSESPGVRVITEGPSEIMIRELTQYEVRVENRGSFDANGIIVRSSLPPWAEVQGNNASIGTVKTVDQSGQAQLQWTIDKLPAGVVERLFIRVKAVKAGTFDVTTDWTIMPQKYVASVTVREPKLSVVIDGPDEIVFGRSEKYRVRVMNPGDGDASNVVFTLAPDSKNPQSQKIGSIPAGKEAQFEIELTARELGELKIGGMATADREVKTVANKSIRIASAAVEAELTGPPLKYQNTTANYHLLLTNSGKAVCEAMEAELRLPLGVTYVSGIPQASVVGDRLVWKIDAMQPGAVREYDLVCKMDRTGDMVIGFNCVGSASGRASVSIETRVEAIADLVLSISDPVAPAPVNADVVYEMTILNRGSKAAQDVRIVAQFSNGIEPTRVEGHSGEVVTGQALFNPISRIEPGTTVRLKVTARAEKAGDHRFRAEVRHGETSLVAEEATMYMEAPAERISRRSTSN